ncbi:hypothetical protein RB594_001180 [Gaeumannomyces avenae]
MGLIVAVPLRRVGFGLDFGGLPPQDSVDTVFGMYVITPIYFSSHTLLKASFLAFYARIFGSPGLGLRFFGMCELASLLRWSHWLNMMLGLILVCLSLGQCSPPSYFWTQWARAHDGRCPINLTALLWSQSVSNVMLDFWVLVLPLSQIPRLNKSWAAKVGVAAMFSLGIITTIVSVIRVIKFSAVGIVCACFPGLRLFALVTIPRTWRWLHRSLGGSRTGSHLSSGPSNLVRTGASEPHSARRAVGGSLLEPTAVEKEDDEPPPPTSHSSAWGEDGEAHTLTDEELWIARPASVPLPARAYRGDANAARRGTD